MAESSATKQNQLVADENPAQENPKPLKKALQRQRRMTFAEVNAELGGALDGTPTWENERKKAAQANRLPNKLQKLIAWIQGTRIVRANTRYTAGRGYLLAGGIAYSALFSIAGALVVAFTFLSFSIGGNDELFHTIVEKTNEVLPGIMKTESDPSGLLQPSALIVRNPFNIVTFISLLVSLWTALSLMSGLRLAIWNMFGIARLPMPFVSQKIRDLGAFIVLGLGVLLTISITALASFFAEPIFDLLNFPSRWARLTMSVVSLVIGLLIDTLVFVFIFVVLAGIKAPQKDLWTGCLLAGALSATVRALGTTAVSSVADNPLLAPFAALATLLLWVNLIARITLNAAAFIANPPEILVLNDEYFPHAKHSPNYVTKSDLRTLAWDYDPITGVVLPDLRAGFLKKVNQEVATGALALQKEYARLESAAADRRAKVAAAVKEQHLREETEQAQKRAAQRAARKRAQAAVVGFDPYGYDPCKADSRD